MTEKELKNLCIDAVISRATKQKPFIRQVYYLCHFLTVMGCILHSIFHKIIYLDIDIAHADKILEKFEEGKG